MTYFLIPYVFGESKKLQALNLINIALLVLHWKLLGNRCILYIIEKRVCGHETKYSIDDLTFSNIVQSLLISAVLIAVCTLYGRPMDLKLRLFLLGLNFLVVFLVIPLSKIYKTDNVSASSI